TSRTKTVEDTLGQTRTQYEALTQTVNTQTGQIESINRKTADLQSGIDGVRERFESLQVGGKNLIAGSKTFVGTHWEKVGTWRLEEALYKEAGVLTWVSGNKVSPMANIAVDAGEVYTFSAFVKKESIGTIYFYLYDPTESRFATANVARETRIENVGNNFQRFSISFTATRTGMLRPRFAIQNSDTGGFSVAGYQLERGSLPTDYNESTEDFRSEFATYVRNASENSAELVKRIETADGKAVDAKSYAQQTAEDFESRIESLETYKDAEGTRAQAYFTAAKNETAKQLTAERAVIANNYLAKSVYDEDARGNTLKLNEIKSTADTAKQNLATYQNTVDRKLEELTSSTQTLDGKISTASSKVDTVAGQIRTEISEVEGKIPTSVGGRNLIKNGGFPTNTQYWSGQMVVSQHDFYYNRQQKLFLLQTTGTAEITASTNRFEVKRNTDYTLSFYVFASSNVCDSDVYFLGRKSNETDNFTSASRIVGNCRFSKSKSEYITITFNSGNNDSGYIRFDNNGSTNGQVAVMFFGEVMLVEGTTARTFEPSPEEVMDEVKNVKTTITNTARGVEQLSKEVSNVDDKITTAEAEIRNLVDEVSSKVSQTDYNTLTGRVDNAETAITQNATEISKRLTSTQVDKAITDKGYATVAVLENKVKETADSFSRTISETKALIPSDFGGYNLVQNGAFPTDTQYWSGSMIVAQHVFYYNGQKKLFSLQTAGTAEITASTNRFEVKRNTDYTLSFYAFAGSNVRHSDVYFLGRKSNETSNFTYANAIIYERRFLASKIEYVTVTFNSGDNDNGYIRFDNNGSSDGVNAVLFFGEIMLVEGRTARKWEPSYAELVTVTKLHTVEDTLDSHTRTIGAVGTTGSILDNVSKV
ncbi:TPA: hypothetical protein ACGO8M_002372, partial [Streptococcus suis]